MADSVSVPEPEVSDGSSRRSFLGLTAVIGVVMGAMVGYPIARLFLSPLTRAPEPPTWVPVGPASEFAGVEEERKQAVYSFEHQDGWYSATRERRVLVGKENGQWVVFSTTCTHLGCGVVWNADERYFHCPCHGGEFHADGTVRKGPPTEALIRLEARVNEETDVLEVREV